MHTLVIPQSHRPNRPTPIIMSSVIRHFSFTLFVIPSHQNGQSRHLHPASPRRTRRTQRFTQAKGVHSALGLMSTFYARSGDPHGSATAILRPLMLSAWNLRTPFASGTPGCAACSEYSGSSGGGFAGEIYNVRYARG